MDQEGFFLYWGEKILLEKGNTYYVIDNAKGTVSYKFVSVNRGGFKKFFKLNKKTGKLTIKKGLNNGTYKLKIKVKASGNKNYLSAVKTVNVKVKVTNYKTKLK